MIKETKMIHCQNYLCKVNDSCICPCNICVAIKAHPCPTCGVCPTCGQSTNPPYYLYPYQWFCYACMMWHYGGYQCLQPYGTIISTTITNPSTYIPNTWIPNYTNTDTINVGYSSANVLENIN